MIACRFVATHICIISVAAHAPPQTFGDFQAILGVANDILSASCANNRAQIMAAKLSTTGLLLTLIMPNPG